MKQKLLDFEITIDTKEELIERAFSEEFFRIVTFNPEMLINAQKNIEFKSAIQKAQVLIPDGIGIVFLLKKLGLSNIKRIAGIELAWSLLEKAIHKKLKISLIGSSQEVLDETIKKLKTKFGSLNLVYARNGFFDETEENKIITELDNARPDLTLIAMPFIRQEIFLAKVNLKGISIGVGGSFDVWANKVKRAPVAWQNLGLEWLWRICSQPERIKRIGNIFFPFFKIYWSI